MNGGRSYVTIVLGFICFTSINCQDCALYSFYCPKTKTCDRLGNTECDTSICTGLNVFPCEDGANCYTVLDRCDTVKDCLNGADEKLCASFSKPNFMKCVTSRSSPACKSSATRTTIRTTVRTSRCGSFETECDGGRSCYSSSDHCDGLSDCSDGSDERDCSVCSGTLLRCDDSNGCYRDSDLCDGVNDCADQSDEKNCAGGIPNGAIIGAVVAVFVVACVVIGCKKILQHTGRQDNRSSPQGAVAYRSAANYRAANPSFQSSHTYNNNNASTDSPQVYNVDPYAPPSYPVAPYGGFSTTPYNDTTVHPPASAPPPDTAAPPPASSPPPTYETLFPSK